MDNNLIFDIGIHRGIDAEYYLGKGFRVVGLEARSDLCATSAERLVSHVKAGNLVIIEAALFDEGGKEVSFFVNPDKDDWGSLFRGQAEKGVGKALEILVPTVTLGEIINAHGVPRYIKCDIEGGDSIFASQLVNLREKPRFVSIEVTNVDDIASLQRAGYTHFQVVNQWLHPFVIAPNPSREGKFVDAQFTHESSGLFGLDLPREGWIPFEEASSRVGAWHALRLKDANLAIGWLDVHATTDAAWR
jgi:FkbM family methyltransferase